MVADPINYCDEPGYRVLDLRPDGIDCVPVLGFSSFLAVRQGPDFHYHPGCMEFCLCIKGNLIFDTVDGEYPFLPGQVFVSSPDQPHHLRNNPSGLVIHRLLFRIPRQGQRILGLDRRGSEWLTRSLTHLPKRTFASTSSVRDAFSRLFDLYDGVSRKSPSRRVRMQAAVLDLLIGLIEAARRTPCKAPEKVLEISRRISDAPDCDYRAEDLAEECGVSVSTFVSGFKRANGLPLHAYLLNCRINRAKALLLKTDRTISSIGQELRFYSTQHFARTFRRIIGVNPQKFRDQNS